MAKQSSSTDAHFQIRLVGFKLDATQQARLEVALRSALLQEIARMDFRETFEVSTLGGLGVLPGIEAKVRNEE
jgi:hypothetical protein